MADQDLALGLKGFNFADLYEPVRLKALHGEFWKFAETNSPGLKGRFDGAPSLPAPKEADVLIEVGHQIGHFLAALFQIQKETKVILDDAKAWDPVFRFKRDFLNLRVFKRFNEAPMNGSDFTKVEGAVEALLKKYYGQKMPLDEGALAPVALLLMDAEKGIKANALDPKLVQKVMAVAGASTLEAVQAAQKPLEDFCTHLCTDTTRRKRVAGWLSYVRPQKLDFEHLVPVERPDPALPEKMKGHDEHLRHRDGFKLTDPRMDRPQYLREIDYCLFCHEREKDSCSKGFPEKTGGYKKNPLGISLTGCPLDERISEMHKLRQEGDAIGALAMVVLDNPMCPGTGHRICNDCMKGCIFQKQDPVNIPQAETGILTDVLNLPYGFEIYSLLTRWNPLNRERPVALPYNGVDIMVVGLGPAGYTLSHFLANQGFGVVGIDALKLEPVPDEWTGANGKAIKPIRDFDELKKALDERILMGFGGVSEYGITVRWDKNFLAVIYLTLLRRKNLRFYGGVRFGGTLTLDDAWELGFKHVAIATGAGKPTIIPMKNNLIRGIRKASDLLMALQLTGAFKRSQLANLQIRLPSVVIGGGLTAIDTATEIFAYYPVQVEKTLDRFEKLSAKYGEDSVWKMCDEEETGILKEFLEHGRAIRNERKKAAAEQREPNLVGLVRSWGGVSLVYRKTMQDSPAYRLNHEEVVKALEEGIHFIENLSPTEAVRDTFGAVASMKFKRADGTEVELAARSVSVAAGTSPNTIYEREKPGTFKTDEKGYFFQKYRAVESGSGFELNECAPGEKGFFLSYEKEGKFVSYYGDNHPDYAGNVVKAMASAKHGSPEVERLFKGAIVAAEVAGQSTAKFEKLLAHLDDALVPKVVEVKRLTPTIVEVIVKGRYASRKFEPGQFYRLQNYETSATVIDGVRLTLEGIALTGAWVDKEKDLLSLIVLEMGVSSRLVATLRPGEPVIVMGPTGEPSETPGGETVLLVGGGLGNAVLFSIAAALKAAGSKVIYFAGYRNPQDVFHRDQIEAGTDQVVWAVDRGEPIKARRTQDRPFVGNIVEAMVAYASGKLGGPPQIPFSEVNRIIAIGSDRMMAAVAQARHGVLQPFLNPKHHAIASINSPMQCMMKEVCAQCLQKHIDPVTKKETVVFTCFNQDQDMDKVDFANLRERLKMNSLSEKLSARFLDLLFDSKPVERV